MKTKTYISEIQVTHRPTTIPNLKINSIKKAVETIRQFWTDDIEYVEKVYLMLLDAESKVTGVRMMYQGSNTNCLFDCYHILQIAIICNSKNIILFHNHPSGQLQPSTLDIKQTKKLFRLAQEFSITLVDHIIISDKKHISCKRYI